MWPLVTFTLCFRGLMIIHRVETVDPHFFEAGVVSDELHFLRINTIKNGVLAATDFLEVNEEHRIWKLEVDNAIGAGASAYIRGDAEDFDREHHPYERDFRWITELGELFENIEEKIDTTKFVPVLRIHNGLFSTRVKSEELEKLVNGESFPFGSIASVVACDIPVIAGGSARIIEEATGRTVFTFEMDENTIYEFANTPADVPHGAGSQDPAHPDDADPAHGGPAAAPDPCKDEHFKRYYKLFKRPGEEDSICFKKLGPHPAPDPATCGAAGTGGIKGPFGG